MKTPDKRPSCPWCQTKLRGPRKVKLKEHATQMDVIKYVLWCSKCGAEGPLCENESGTYSNSNYLRVAEELEDLYEEMREAEEMESLE